MRGLKKLSAAQRKLKTENLTKNGMPKLLACVYVEIVAIPLIGKEIKDPRIINFCEKNLESIKNLR